MRTGRRFHDTLHNNSCGSMVNSAALFNLLEGSQVFCKIDHPCNVYMLITFPFSR